MRLKRLGDDAHALRLPGGPIGGEGACEAAPSLIEINGPIPAPCKHDSKPDAASEMNSMDMTIYLLILIAAFVGIVAWVFGRKRKARFEKDARIPFDGKR